MISVNEVLDLMELQRLMDEAYEHYFANGDGHCKSSEGYVGLHFNNFFDRQDGQPFGIARVEVYSYVLGSGRSHHFPSTSVALEAVREWHAREMATDHAAEGVWS